MGKLTLALIRGSISFAFAVFVVVIASVAIFGIGAVLGQTGDWIVPVWYGVILISVIIWMGWK